jgi:hypothetical protein
MTANSGSSFGLPRAAAAPAHAGGRPWPAAAARRAHRKVDPARSQYGGQATSITWPGRPGRYVNRLGFSPER